MAQGWGQGEAVAARERVVGLVRELPEVELEDSNGHTGFLQRGRKFAWLLVDHHGDGRLALWVKAPPGEQDGLVAQDPARYFVPPHLGSRGWVGAQVDPGSDPDWDQLAELVEQAWRMSAPRRTVTAYDADHPSPSTAP